MTTKNCSKCQLSRSLERFGLKNGKIRSDCKDCNNEYSRKYREENPIKVRDSNNKYNNTNREKCRSWNKKHFDNNKDRVRERARNNYEKYSQDPNFVIIHSCRNRINKLISRETKNSKTNSLLGCSSIFLIEWLEYQFDSKMNWKNYGSFWHIDHVVPCSSFNLEIEEEQQKCFNWKNIRPYNGSKNISKGNKILPETILLQEIKVYYYVNNIKASTTTLSSKEYEGTRLIVVPNGKNVEDGTIRSQASKHAKFI
jgi:hypothetical protein